MKCRHFLQVMAAAGLITQAPLSSPRAHAATTDKFVAVWPPVVITNATLFLVNKDTATCSTLKQILLLSIGHQLLCSLLVVYWLARSQSSHAARSKCA